MNLVLDRGGALKEGLLLKSQVPQLTTLIPAENKQQSQVILSPTAVEWGTVLFPL
jgi:hypothetical protein